MTALHWAAINGDAELAADAALRRRERARDDPPRRLHAAAPGAQAGTPRGRRRCWSRRGADVNAPTATGATPLMLAARPGNTDAVQALLDARRRRRTPRNRRNGQTALMFAAAADRAEVVRLLLARGADARLRPRRSSTSPASIAPEDSAAAGDPRRADRKPATAGGSGTPRPAAAPPCARTPAANETPGVDARRISYNELIGKQGGLTALHFAARQGAMADGRGAARRPAPTSTSASAGDATSPLLVATINGHFDLASYLLDNGADPNLASDAGVTPLYAVLNVQWAPRSFYPQPRAYLQQKLRYLELMKALLDKGADPNARLNRKIWYTQYNFDLLRIDEIGATPFWRAAYASDIEAMKLLVAYGADPDDPDDEAGRTHARFGDGDARDARRRLDGCRRCRSAARHARRCRPPPASGYGEGFAGNAHRFAPTGMLAAVKYLVEELGADVNAEDARRQHRRAPRRLARRQRDDPVPRVEGRRREEGQPRRPDHGGHGQRPGAAHAAVSRDDQAARGPGREEQPQVRVLLILGCHAAIAPSDDQRRAR